MEWWRPSSSGNPRAEEDWISPHRLKQ